MKRPTKLDKLLWLLEEVRIADKFIEEKFSSVGIFI